MNEQERSLFDEIWEAAGLKEEPKQEPTEEVSVEPAPVSEEPIAEEAGIEEPAIEETVEEEPSIEEVPAKETKIKKTKKNKEKPAKKAKKEKKPTQDHAEKKKSVKFLVIYTIVFVIVISALISSSYMISQRIHMENNEAHTGEHQSTLQNIKDKNETLKKENDALKEQNESLTLSEQDSTELLDSAADMIEHQEYLSAAMAKYIDGNRADARTILSTVDRSKLSPTAKEYYDLLDQKLN